MPIRRSYSRLSILGSPWKPWTKAQSVGVDDTLIIDEAQDLLRHAYLDVFDLLLKEQLESGTSEACFDPYQNSSME